MEPTNQTASAERKNYITKQKTLLLELFGSTPRQTYTAKQLIERADLCVGEATIYRLLIKLTKEGRIHRIAPPQGGATLYQYNPMAGCHNHLHLKCDDCQGVTCMNCDWVEEFNRHVHQAYQFTITQESTIIHGRCHLCATSSK